MNYTKPSYYDQFECIAGECPDTCCAGWEIVIDDETMQRYKNLKGGVGEYIMSNVDVEEGVYKRCGTRCAFLNSDNLCDLIINSGEDKLCKTCDKYPRHFEEYGNLLESLISLSCPVAARMIIDREERDSFVSYSDDKAPLSKDVDKALLEGIHWIREKVFDILGDRNDDINTRIKRILAVGEATQPFVYEYGKMGAKKYIPFVRKKKMNSILQVLQKEDCLEICDKYIKQKGNIEKVQSLMKSCMEMYTSLENINDKWPAMIEEVISTLYNGLSEVEYLSLREEFLAYMKNREYEYEHMLIYFIYAYLLGGVYDYNVQGMIKFSVISVLVIREIGFAHWIKNNRQFTVEDQIRYSYLFSRQVEHSSNNVLCLEGIFTAHPLFCIERIYDIL
ncbi:MAG: flagellin lysine-N-methylase [Lachnospiraceae bacterium]|nr:flagellin lysine-N-methylase [Lachnospiraceae bacterium]